MRPQFAIQFYKLCPFLPICLSGDNDSKNLGKRPPNKECPVCGRKSPAPETSFGKWVFPPQKKCHNCTSLEHKVFKQINANKRILIKSQKQADAVFPLLVLDIDNDELVGIYHDFKSLRRDLNKYRSIKGNRFPLS